MSRRSHSVPVDSDPSLTCASVPTSATTRFARRPAASNPAGFEALLLEQAFIIAPSDAQLRAAEAAARELCGGFHHFGGERWRFEGVIPFGSSSRGTAVAPLKDCDRILYFRRNQSPRRGMPASSATAFLEEIATHVRHQLVAADIAATWRLREQSHSIGLILRGDHLSVDLVPVVAGPGTRTVWLPERSTDRWIPACPHAMQRQLASLQVSQPRLLESIRLLKSWRRAQRIHFTSYAIELLQTRQVARVSRPLPLPELLRGFFQPIARSSPRRRLVLGRTTFPEPASLRDPWTGANILSSMTAVQRMALIDAARDAIACLDTVEALTHQSPHEARRRLRELFVGPAVSSILSIHTHYEPASPWFSREGDR